MPRATPTFLEEQSEPAPLLPVRDATRVLELGDERSLHRPVPMQVLVDASGVRCRLADLGLA